MPTPSEELDRIMALEAPPQLAERGSKDEFFSSTKATATQSTAPTKDNASETTTSSSTSSSTDSSAAAATTTTEEPKIDYESYLLLKPHTIKELIKSFKLEHQLSVELTRARQQTIKSIQSGKMDKLEEAASGHPEHGDGV